MQHTVPFDDDEMSSVEVVLNDSENMVAGVDPRRKEYLGSPVGTANIRIIVPAVTTTVTTTSK